jgi:hypothetical protein
VAVTVDVDEERRPSAIGVTLPGLQVECRYYDYGIAALPGSAPDATPLGGPSRLGFARWAVKAALRRERP